MHHNFPNNANKSSYHQNHRSSYYNAKYSRSHFSTPYHPRLINNSHPPQHTSPYQRQPTPQQAQQTQQQPQQQQQQQQPTQSTKSSDLFIKKKSNSNHSTQMSSISSDGSSINSNHSHSRNTRFNSRPIYNGTTSTNTLAQVQLINNTFNNNNNTSPTISFSSQHTAQSFVAAASATGAGTGANNSTNTVISSVDTTNSNASIQSQNNNNSNDVYDNKNKSRRTRWNSKPDHMIINNTNGSSNITNITTINGNTIVSITNNTNNTTINNNNNDKQKPSSQTRNKSHSRSTHRTSRRHRNNTSSSRSKRSSRVSRSRSRNKYNLKRRNRRNNDNHSGSNMDDIDMDISGSSESGSYTSISTTSTATNNNNLQQIRQNQNNNDKIKKKLYPISANLHSFNDYFYRNTNINYAENELNRRLVTYNKHNKKLHNKTVNDVQADPNQNPDDEWEEYNRDLNDYYYSVYSSPYKKPRYMDISSYVSCKKLPSRLIYKLALINRNLSTSREKKKKLRRDWINTDRSQSSHWNKRASPSWFYRCVNTFSDQINNICSSPQMASGVAYPEKILNEIEKQLSRIHPFPPKIYKKLMLSLFNLSSLIRTYPSLKLNWNKDNKLQSVYHKAIRKQKQMSRINNDAVTYNFEPFKLPNYEQNNLSFNIQTDNDDDDSNNVSLEPSSLVPNVSCISKQESIVTNYGDDDDDDDDDEEDNEEDNIYIKSRSITPFDMTPALSLTSNTCTNDNELNILNINGYPKKNVNNKTRSRVYIRSKSLSLTPRRTPIPQTTLNAPSTSVSVPLSQSQSIIPQSQQQPRSLPPQPHSVTFSRKMSQSRMKAAKDDLEMDIQPNLDLVRKTKVSFSIQSSLNNNNNNNIFNKFIVSPKIEKLVEINVNNINKINKMNKINNRKRKFNSINQSSYSLSLPQSPSLKYRKIKNNQKQANNNNKMNKNKRTCTRVRNHEWKIQSFDSDNDNIASHLKEKKELLRSALDNGCYGPLKAHGLKPTYSELPILQNIPNETRFKYVKRLPSIAYLISNYIDINDPIYIRMLLKYFTIQLDKCVVKKDDKNDKNDIHDNPKDIDVINNKLIRKQLKIHPSILLSAAIGFIFSDISDLNIISSIIYINHNNNNEYREYLRKIYVIEIYINLYNKQYLIKYSLNPLKKHQLLCTLIRIKNKYKMKSRERKHQWGVTCIPQPPPPHSTTTSDDSSRISLMYQICINYNWNGLCLAPYCSKKHICSFCFDKHSSRICNKICHDYNWAKCKKYCPKNKKHSCTQCGNRTHQAWKCPFLNKFVKERYYSVYKAKKVKNGYFKQLQKKSLLKNMQKINKKIQKTPRNTHFGMNTQCTFANNNVITINNQNNQQSNNLYHYHQQKYLKTRKRINRK